jgi:fido (protein-threonine AMPylation protein)
MCSNAMEQNKTKYVRKPIITIPHYLYPYCHPFKCVLFYDACGEKKELYCYEQTKQELENYRRALTLIEAQFLLKSFICLTEIQFLVSIKLLHSVLQKDIVSTAGQFRTQEAYIDKHRGKYAFHDDQFLEDLRKNEPTSVHLYQTVLLSLQTASSFEDAVKTWTPEQRVFFEKYVQTTPSARSIENQLIESWKQLKYMNDPLEQAAFIHLEISRIHPFEDANGRLARLVMNIILMQAGYAPFIALLNKEYTAQIQQGVRDRTVFVAYLKRCIIALENKLIKGINPLEELLIVPAEAL